MEFNREKKIKELFDSIGNGKIKIVSGLRQVGKSYLLHNLFIPKLKNNLNIKDKDILYLELSYEHPEIRTSFKLNKHINSKHAKDEFKYLIIDEVQLAGKGYEDVIKNFHQMNKDVEIFLTGSNSEALSNDIIIKYKEHRHVIEVEPLSYSEIIFNFKQYSFDDYLIYGGIPRVLNAANKNEEIGLLFEELYLGDLTDRRKYEYLSEDRKKRILVVIFSTINPVSEKSITKQIVKKLGINKSEIAKLNKEIGDFLDWCENSYLFKKLENENYEINKKEPTVNRNMKYYAIDNGLLNFNYEGDKREEKLIENIVFLELNKLGLTIRGSTLKFEKGNGEIDFTFIYNNQKFNIQVTHTLKPSDYNREIGNLLKTDSSSRRILIYKNNLIGNIDKSIEKYKVNSFIKGIKGIIK